MSFFQKVGEFLGSLSTRLPEVSGETSNSSATATAIVSNNKGDNNQSLTTNTTTNTEPQETHWGNNAATVQSIFNESPQMTTQVTTQDIAQPATPSVNPFTNLSVVDQAAKYASMTDAQKIASLEKAVSEQGVYLKALKESMKVLNRRNTLAVIELQMLVRDCEVKHPDLQEIINPVMQKVSKVLDFKQPYEV